MLIPQHKIRRRRRVTGCYALAAVLVSAFGSTLADDGKPTITPGAPALDRYGDPLPAGAVARLGTLRLRHASNSGLWTGFSPDAKLLVTVNNESVRFWETDRGRIVHELPRRNYQSYGPIAFAPHGRWVAVVRDRSILLLDPKIGAEIGRLELPPNEAGAPVRMVVSSDGKSVAATTFERVFVWDCGQEKAVPLEPKVAQDLGGKVPTIRFSPDRKSLVGVEWNRVRRWDVETGKQLSEITFELPSIPRTWQVSSDGSVLAASLRQPNAVRLVDTATGKTLRDIDGAGLAPWHSDFTSDGSTLAVVWRKSDAAWSASDNPILRLYEVATGELRRQWAIPGHQAWLGFTPDGGTLLTGGYVAGLRLWNAATGQSRLSFDAHDGAIRAVDFAPDSRTIVSGAEDGDIRVWDAATGAPRRVLPGHRSCVFRVVVMPDGRSVLSCGVDDVVRMQELETGREVRRFALKLPPEAKNVSIPHQIGALGLSPDGKTVVCLATSSSGQRAVHDFHLWNVETGNLLAHRGVPQQVSFQGFAPDPKMLLEYRTHYSGRNKVEHGKAYPIVSSYEWVLRDWTSGRQLAAFSTGNYAFRHAFAPDELLLATDVRQSRLTLRGWRETYGIRVWELPTGKERVRLDAGGFGGYFDAMAFDASGRRLAVARSDRSWQVFDVVTGRELLRQSGHHERVGALCFSPDGRFLASGHTDSTILVWDVSKARAGFDARPVAAAELEKWWQNLASDDGRVAHEAIGRLAAAGKQALALLKARLQPVKAPKPEHIQRLIDDLSSTEFKKRDAAARGLAQMGEQAAPALRAALERSPTQETRIRLERLLSTPSLSADIIRHIRALHALEWMDDSDARPILERLAKGDPHAIVTQTAKKALDRIR